MNAINYRKYVFFQIFLVRKELQIEFISYINCPHLKSTKMTTNMTTTSLQNIFLTKWFRFMYSCLSIHSSLYFVKSLKKYAFKILFVELAVEAKFCSMWWPVLCVYLAVHMIARGESHLFCVTMPRNSVNAFFGIQFIPVKFHPVTFRTHMFGMKIHFWTWLYTFSSTS